MVRPRHFEEAGKKSADANTSSSCIPFSSAVEIIVLLILKIGVYFLFLQQTTHNLQHTTDNRQSTMDNWQPAAIFSTR